MTMKRRISTVVGVALVGLAVSAPRAGAADLLTGDWSGSYTCFQGLTRLALVIMPDGQQWSGTFMFAPHKTNKDVPFGSYEIAVSESDGVYTIEPGQWIDQPDGYVPVGGSGTLSSDLMTFSGTLDFAGCEGFEAIRQTPLPSVSGKTK